MLNLLLVSMALSATLGESDATCSAVLPMALAILPGIEAGAVNVDNLPGAMLLGGFPGL